MVKFDPNNELNETELELLGESNFDDFLDYLDQKAEHLKQFTKPLSSYHTKRYASMSAQTDGKEFTTEEMQLAAEIGKKNEVIAAAKVVEKLKEFDKKNPKYTDEGIKNIKTHRSQWFD
tara:strand:+ start:405 stop:761 length:357 start_codon:yes stop_codon:yes gene_type:complete